MTATTADLGELFVTYSKACRSNRPCKTVLRLLEGHAGATIAASAASPTASFIGGRSPLAHSVPSMYIETPKVQQISTSGTSPLSVTVSPQATSGSVQQQQLQPCSPLLPPLTALDFTSLYVGNRSLVAVFRLIKDHIPSLETLRLPNAGLFIGDSRPTNVSGNKVIAELCISLEGHPSLREVDLSNNGLGTDCYLNLVRFVKATPSLEKLVLDGCLLQQHEQQHLTALVAVNAKHKQEQASNLSTSVLYLPGVKPGGRNAAAKKRQADASGSPRSGTKKIVSAGSSLHVIQYEPHPTKPQIVSASTLKDIISRKSRTYLSQVLSNVDAGNALGSNAVKVPIQHPSMREYHKAPEVSEALKLSLRRTVQFQAFQRLVFPTIPQPRSDRSSLVNPKSLDFGPTVEEREHDELVELQKTQVDLVLEKLVASLQLAVYKNGEYVTEAGDVATFVFLVEQGQSGTGATEQEDVDKHLDLVSTIASEVKQPQQQRGDKTTPSGNRPSISSSGNDLTHFVEMRGADGEIAITYRPGSLFGELELLAADPDTPPLLTRRMSAFARCPEGATLRLWLLHKDVFHMYLADPIATSRVWWRRLVDAMPCLTTCPPQLRSCLADILVSTVVTTVRSATGETEAAEPVRISGPDLANNIVIVDEGLVGVMRNGALVAELGRGDIFLLQRGATTAGLELTHIVGNMPSWRYCIVPLTEVARLPKELWKFLAVASRIYDGTNAAVKAIVDSQVSKLFIKTTRHPKETSPARSQ